MQNTEQNEDQSNKYKREKTFRKFLLSFFNPDKGYEEKEVNGFWLIKQFNKIWTVAVYTSEAYLKRKRNKERFGKTSYMRPRGNGGSEDK